MLREQAAAEQRAREMAEEEERRQQELNVSSSSAPSRSLIHHTMSVHVDYEPGLEGIKWLRVTNRVYF